MGGKRRIIVGHSEGKIETVTAGPIPHRSRLHGQIETPTGDSRHISWIRDGRISHEVFARAELSKIPVDFDVTIDRMMDGRKEPDNARKEPKAAKVGLRGEGGSVGQEASLQQAAPKPKEVSKAKARKKVSRKKGDNG